MTIQRTQPEWPVQLRLPGQTAAPEGPVDMTLMYVMHHAFRRDLAKFADAARHTPVEDRLTWRLLAKRWDVFSRTLHHHHSGEDAGVWPWLLEHGDESDRETLEAMEAEHADIDPALRGCAEGIARLAEHADEDARAALAVRLAATKEALNRHLRHEETDAIAIIQRLMTPEDWHAVDEEHFKHGMPFSLVVELVPWATYGLTGEALDRAFAHAGAGFKLVWLATRGRFARREAKAFRYVD